MVLKLWCVFVLVVLARLFRGLFVFGFVWLLSFLSCRIVRSRVRPPDGAVAATCTAMRTELSQAFTFISEYEIALMVLYLPLLQSETGDLREHHRFVRATRSHVNISDACVNDMASNGSVLH